MASEPPQKTNCDWSRSVQPRVVKRKSIVLLRRNCEQRYKTPSRTVDMPRHYQHWNGPYNRIPILNLERCKAEWKTEGYGRNEKFADVARFGRSADHLTKAWRPCPEKLLPTVIRRQFAWSGCWWVQILTSGCGRRVLGYCRVNRSQPAMW